MKNEGKTKLWVRSPRIRNHLLFKGREEKSAVDGPKFISKDLKPTFTFVHGSLSFSAQLKKKKNRKESKRNLLELPTK